MKIYFKILFLFLFSLKLSAQESIWKKKNASFHQKIIKENSDEILKNNDSLNLAIYTFQRNEKIDTTKFQMMPVKTSFENLKLKLEKSNLELKKNSEYLLKYETSENTEYKYSFYLDENIKQEQVKKLIYYLKYNYQIDKIKYISKHDATKIAAETLGVNSKDLFQDDVFPASIEIESKIKINSKNIQNKYPQLITDTLNDDLDVEILIIKVTT